MTAENSSSRFRRGIILALTVLLVLASYFINSKLLETGWDSWGDIVFTSTLGSEPQQGQDIEPIETDDLSCHQPRPISLESLPKTLPKPIVHLGMPKTGTTTMEAFFKCGGVHTSHSVCKVTNDVLLQSFFESGGVGTKGLLKNGECLSHRVWEPCKHCPECMWAAKNHSLPLLESCGGYDVWMQVDTVESHCFFPQLSGLDLIHEESPSATFLYMFRDVDNWINSISHFRGGSTKRRLQKCGKKGRIPFLEGSKPDQLRKFRCESVKYVRNFVENHPSHTLIEIDLDNPESGKILSQLFEIDEECWAIKNVNTKLHNNTLDGSASGGQQPLDISIEPIEANVDLETANVDTKLHKTIFDGSTSGSEPQQGQDIEPIETDDLSCHQPRPISLESLPKTLPKPIVHLGMPKTGTTTMEAFFKCGGVHTSHSVCKVTNDVLLQSFFESGGVGTKGLLKNGECLSHRVWEPCKHCPECMWAAKNHSLPLLESCGGYDVWMQVDTVESHCFFPQLSGLDLIHEESPSATFLYMFRDVDNWINSISHFRGGSTKRRLQKCGKKGRIPFLEGSKPDQLRKFRCESVKYVRNFVENHPSHTLIEIDLDNPESGKILSQLFEIDEECWVIKNVNTKLHNNTVDK